MHHILKAVAMAVALALGACAAVRVSTDYDPATGFQSLRSWAWAARQAVETEERRIPDPLRDRRIEEAIADLLAEKGFSLVDRDAADFLVTFHVAVEKGFEYSEVPVTIGYWGYWGGFYGTRAYVNTYQERSLLIDVLDRDGETLLWRGVGVERLRDYASPAEREKNIRAVVTAILERFPPR